MDKITPKSDSKGDDTVSIASLPTSPTSPTSKKPTAMSTTTPTSTRSRAKGSNKKKTASVGTSSFKKRKLTKEEEFFQIQMRLHVMMDLARYELEVDAYRGIFDPRSYSSHQKKTNNQKQTENVGGVSSNNDSNKNDTVEGEGYRYYDCHGLLNPNEGTGDDDCDIDDDGMEVDNKCDNSNRCHNSNNSILTCPCVKSLVEPNDKNDGKSLFSTPNKRHKPVQPSNQSRNDSVHEKNGTNSVINNMSGDKKGVSKNNEVGDNKDDSGEGGVDDGDNNDTNTTAQHSKKERNMNTNFNDKASHATKIKHDDDAS